MESRNNVQVVCKEIIKPSSETPSHLHQHQLSWLDQSTIPAYIHLILFYESPQDDQQQVSKMLKQSLAETLVTFYPVAGKLDHEKQVVHCIDSGAEYVETRVLNHVSVFDAIQHHQNPESDQHQLKQYHPATTGDLEHVLLRLQVNFFDCGGFAIGLCMWHAVGDVASLVSLVNSWAAVCSGGKLGVMNKPDFSLAKHFPVRDLSATSPWLQAVSDIKKDEKEEPVLTKRIVFDKENLEKLKKLAVCPGNKNPTRVELVSAFIWKYFILMRMARSENSTTSNWVAAVAVNWRRRVVPPPQLEHTFGNCATAPVGTISRQDDPPEYHHLVCKIRDVIRSVNDAYLRDGCLKDIYNSVDLLLRGGADCFVFTSWCNFPVYEADYGWGKPVWVATADFPNNLAVLIDTQTGDGIEAWFRLQHHDAQELIGSLSNALKNILP